MEVGRSVKSESVLSQRKWVANFLLFIITSNVGCMKYNTPHFFFVGYH